MATTRERLFRVVDGADMRERGHKKVTIVGVGAVGMAAAYATLNQGLASELCLIDVAEDKLRGEALDLKHGKAFMKNVIIKAGSDYALSANSNIVVITAGVRQRVGESRLDLVGRNLEIFKHIVPQVVTHSPNCTICVVSNPCDIMTWITWKLSGFPPSRVFGSGTALDSSRFRMLIAERLGVDTRSVHGYILGEHGDSSVPAWSAVTVGGVRLESLSPKIGTAEDEEDWGEIHRSVVGSAGEVIRLKGYTSWAIGVVVANLVEICLRDERRVMPISTLVKGQHGVEQEVFLSVPCIVGASGALETINVPLSESERGMLQKSASTIFEVQSKLGL